ncbi:MAG: transporter permease, partial [Frankiales bacterium]|nr:transporter permease [Frankiales bacterium]
VQQVNALGGVVLSRAVVEDPPPDDQVPDLSGYTDHTTAALVGLIVVIAVLEVVLLAGPAFAVGARRQRRALALLAAGGGEPRHVRRVVLAQGLLVGVTAAVVSAGLGVGLAAGAVPVLQRHTAAGFGPFETSPRDIALFCLLGAVTAVLAALVPAALAARQPVVAALQGRRVVPGRTGLPTVAGLVLLVVGVLACRASLDKGSAELWVAFSAVPTVLGAALLAPALLALVGRSAARLPLPLRYAVRDADRQRGRTAPAVAAIAATVAAVVALGTSSWSDAAENATRYGPTGPVGTAVVTQFDPAEVPALTAAAGRALPGEPVLVVRGLQAAQGGPDGPQPAVLVCRPDEPAAASCNGFASQYGYLGGDVLVGADGLRAVAPLLQPAGLVQARRALAAGSAVVVGAPAGGQVSLRRVLQRFDPRTGQESAQLLASVTTRAVPLQSRSGTAPVQAVVPDAVAARLGGVGPVSVLVGDDLSKGQERTLRRALTRLDTGTETQVDRGQDDQGRLVLLLLGGVAGFLVLAGTLAASSLALTEARPDLATMGQVGARPRTRRQVAGAYAFVLALVGAVLGCLAGLVPGVAGAVAITRDSYAGAPGGLLTSTLPTGSLHFVRVPWLLLLALVVGLPLLAGAVAALTTRSRLPGVGRRLQP